MGLKAELKNQVLGRTVTKATWGVQAQVLMSPHRRAPTGMDNLVICCLCITHLRLRVPWVPSLHLGRVGQVTRLSI